MKTVNLILTIVLFACIPLAWYQMFAVNDPEQAEKFFYLGFILMLSAVIFFAFYQAEYWKERYEETVGLRPKKQPKQSIGEAS